jgi:hypothetical protein
MRQLVALDERAGDDRGICHNVSGANHPDITGAQVGRVHPAWADQQDEPAVGHREQARRPGLGTVCGDGERQWPDLGETLGGFTQAARRVLDATDEALRIGLGGRPLSRRQAAVTCRERIDRDGGGRYVPLPCTLPRTGAATLLMRPSTAVSTRTDVQRICRSTDDPIALHRAVVERLRGAVGFDRWCGLVLDPATLLFTSSAL